MIVGVVGRIVFANIFNVFDELTCDGVTEFSADVESL